MAQIVWSESASQNVSEIEANSLEQGSDPTKVLTGIFRAIDQLVEFPYQGQSFLRFRIKEARQLIASEDYRILYRTDGEVVLILAVLHTSRHLRNAWKSKPRD